MDGFNSSDIDFSEPADKRGRIGTKALASIVEHAETDRLLSKKTVKTLKDVRNAPSTTTARAYWFTLFKMFAKMTLGIDAREGKTTTGEDVARFISRLPSHLESRHQDGKIAWTVIRDAEKQLNRSLAFHYPNYKLSRHETLRIGAVVQKLLDEGKITRDPVRERQWLTSEIMKKLVTAVIVNAVHNGTKSWDVTVSSCLSLVLQAAMASRSGDFRRSHHYDGEEFLKWRDIQLVVEERNGVGSLRMLIKLRYCKGQK